MRVSSKAASKHAQAFEVRHVRQPRQRVEAVALDEQRLQARVLVHAADRPEAAVVGVQLLIRAGCQEQVVLLAQLPQLGLRHLGHDDFTYADSLNCESGS